MAKTQESPKNLSENEDTFRTLSVPSEGLYKEKGSKFLAFAYPVENEIDIKKHLENLRKIYYDARHHCYAYVLGAKQEIYRANDDGEPSSTAGKPIHGQILSFGLTNVLIVVVRYFGGTKLGTSGLITAYKTASADALGKASVVEKTVMRHYLLSFPYERMNRVMRIVKELHLQVIGQEADTECRMKIAVRLSESKRCMEKFQEERISLDTIS